MVARSNGGHGYTGHIQSAIILFLRLAFGIFPLANNIPGGYRQAARPGFHFPAEPQPVAFQDGVYRGRQGLFHAHGGIRGVIGADIPGYIYGPDVKDIRSCRSGRHPEVVYLGRTHKIAVFKVDIVLVGDDVVVALDDVVIDDKRRFRDRPLDEYVASVHLCRHRHAAHACYGHVVRHGG